MCGIVGLLLKKPELRDQLGELMTPMLVGMTSRGPDSAGVAIFGSADRGLAQAVAVLGRGRRGLEAPRGRAEPRSSMANIASRRPASTRC